MHYVHVKRKENPMNTITLEYYRSHPALATRLQAAARRERSKEMFRLLKVLVEKLTPQALPGRWLARLG